MKKILCTLILAAVSCAALAENATYAIDPTHTFVTFEVRHFNTSTIRGRFDKKQGVVQLDQTGKTGKVDITFETDSISTGVVPFDKHLKSADFFNVEQFPTAQFVSEQFMFNGDKISAVRGQLTLLGKTLPVLLTASRFNCYQSPMLKREVCGGDFEATITRSQWGMTYGLQFSPDQIRLLIQVEAIKQ